MRIPAKEELINKTNNKSKDIMLEKRLNFLKDLGEVLKKHGAFIAKYLSSSNLNYNLQDNNFNTYTYLLAKYGAASFDDISEQINKLEE